MQYTGTYTDKRGSEAIVVDNDGKNLSVRIRGVEFKGSDFDQLAPSGNPQSSGLEAFTFNRGDLCDCRLSFEIPVALVSQGIEQQSLLHVVLELGKPAGNGGIDREHLVLTLVHSGGRIVSSGAYGWFEDELLDLQRQLPAGNYIKTCINCRYSDYNVAGHGLFGDMMCYRNVKEEYLRVKSKMDFIKMADRYERLVQETYLCPDFARRITGTGYRG